MSSTLNWAVENVPPLIKIENVPPLGGTVVDFEIESEHHFRSLDWSFKVYDGATEKLGFFLEKGAIKKGAA